MKVRALFTGFWLVLVFPMVVFPMVVFAEPYTDMVSYKYDGLNRLKSASTGAGIGQSFTLDEVANRTNEIRTNAPVGAPTAISDVYSLNEDTTLNIDAANGVLSNDQTNALKQLR